MLGTTSTVLESKELAELYINYRLERALPYSFSVGRVKDGPLVFLFTKT